MWKATLPLSNHSNGCGMFLSPRVHRRVLTTPCRALKLRAWKTHFLLLGSYCIIFIWWKLRVLSALSSIASISSHVRSYENRSESWWSDRVAMLFPSQDVVFILWPRQITSQVPFPTMREIRCSQVDKSWDKGWCKDCIRQGDIAPQKLVFHHRLDIWKWDWVA